MGGQGTGKKKEEGKPRCKVTKISNEVREKSENAQQAFMDLGKGRDLKRKGSRKKADSAQKMGGNEGRGFPPRPMRSFYSKGGNTESDQEGGGCLGKRKI